MGSCCMKPKPDIQVDIEGNTCFDDMECSSTCCIVKKKTVSPKHHHKNHRDKDPPQEIEMKEVKIDTTSDEPGV